MTDESVPEEDDPRWKRGFWSLFLVQIQGAFSDSLFKLLVVFLITTSITNEVLDSHFSPDVEHPKVLNDELQAEISGKRDPMITTIMLLFALPMILFVMTAGYLSDRFSKSKIVVATKVAEIAIMSLAAAFFYFQFLPGLFAILFLMATQSSFFAPAKLGMLPELLPGRHLSWGNGIMAMGSFFALISGGIAAGVLSVTLGAENAWGVGVGLILLAVVGTFFSFGLPKLEAASPEKKYQLNFVAEIWSSIRLARQDRILILAITGSVYFWFLAALLGEPTVLVYGQDLLQLDDSSIAILRSFLAIGIASGSVAAGIMSRSKIEYGLIPAGSLGLALAGLLMAIPGLTFAHVALLLFVLGVSGGFFIVPVNSLVQFRPAASEKGRVIATERWLTAASVFVALLAFGFLKTTLGLDPAQIFLVGSLLTFAVTLYAIYLLPDALTRLVLWLLTNTIYRLNVKGKINIPDKGGALLVANHMSWADALFIIASTHRHIRFVMHQKMYRRWWIYPFAKMLRCIPVASDMNPRELVRSLNAATEAIKEGQIVCIFAEGQIGHFGQVLPFRRGLNRIIKGVDAPIIPVHLDNVWGSIFSFAKGKFYFKLPRQIPYPITVSYGEALDANTPPHYVRKAVIDLSADAWEERKRRIPNLSKALIRTARRNKSKIALTDETGQVKYLKALTVAMAFCRSFATVLEKCDRVGVFLPNSVQGTLVNWSLILAGKVPVNVHESFGQESLVDIFQKTGVKFVITNRDFEEQLKPISGIEILLVEDHNPKLTVWARWRDWFLARFLPSGMLERKLNTTGHKADIDDEAVVCMSRGRSGQHKCAVLSHYNVVSNCLQVNQVFDFGREDSLLGVIPYSHALGFGTSVVFPAVLGIPTHYCQSAEDARSIGRLVHNQSVTVMFTSPRLMRLYLAGCEANQFGSLRTVLVGGEKLNADLSNEFEDKFGIRPLEAYGCVECAPVVSVNTTDFRSAGIRQVGSKRGSVGLLIPGMTYKIVDPETRTELGFEEFGSLLVKGPNVMRGYVGEDNDEFLDEGWFDTSDFASVDENGFVTVSEEHPDSP